MPRNNFVRGLTSLPNFGNLAKKNFMGKNTSISLGNHFESFIEASITNGRFGNASEVVRAGLRLLEEEEGRLIALKSAIQEGIDSGTAKNFDAKKHLAKLKKQKKNG